MKNTYRITQGDVFVINPITVRNLLQLLERKKNKRLFDCEFLNVRTISEIYYIACQVMFGIITNEI